MKRARKWDRVASSVVSKLTAAIAALPSAELRALRATKRRATGTNCAWSTHRLREFLTDQAGNELNTRRLNHRRLLVAARRALAGRPTGIRGFDR